jgi:hypothetical protein
MRDVYNTHGPYLYSPNDRHYPRVSPLFRSAVLDAPHKAFANEPKKARTHLKPLTLIDDGHREVDFVSDTSREHFVGDGLVGA